MELFDELHSGYGDPARSYHNWEHVASLLALFDAYQKVASSPVASNDAAAVEAAIFFHDVVYDPTAGDNEEQSADCATSTLERCRIDPQTIKKVHRLILTTKHNGANVPVRPDEQVVRDVDLAILGAPSDEYRQYVRAIRKEYGHLSLQSFIAGRKRVVEHFLSLARIFSTEFFHVRREVSARNNLESELADYQ
jgi:predicted metal-dependent HD superfamily phosphohydrolase